MKKLVLILFLLLLFSAPAFATNYTQDANCMGAFLMEDATTETDVSVNGNTLSVSAGDTIPQSADKMFGTYSRDFEIADTEYLEHADGLSTDISGVNQAVSVVVWVKRESDQATFEAICGKWDTVGNQRQYGIWVTDSDIGNFSVSPDGTSASARACASTSTVVVGSWTHLAGVYNDVDVRLYYNSVLESAPTAHVSGVYGGTEPFQIGRYTGATTRRWDGLIDDVGIFNRALTSVEVSDIYTNGLVGSLATGSGLNNCVLNNCVIQ